MIQAKAAAVLEPQAQQRFVEDSAEASLRARNRENTDLDHKLPSMAGD
jgi:hypothetical protein